VSEPPSAALHQLRVRAPHLYAALMGAIDVPIQIDRASISRQQVRMTMRDGVRLATDIYRRSERLAPVVAMRTPYGRASDVDTLLAFVQVGFTVVAQDCRGTGDSEPETWDFGIYEREDCSDFVDWVCQQEWFDGFLGAIGGSYVGGVQWYMAMHPRMSAIAPEVAGLVGSPPSARLYMFLNAYSDAARKDVDKSHLPLPQLERAILSDTLAGGFFNEPLQGSHNGRLLERYPELADLSPEERKRWIWGHFNALPASARAELIKFLFDEDAVTFQSMESLDRLFGHQISRGAPTIVSASADEWAKALHAPALIITAWYDWALGDSLATWELIGRAGSDVVASQSRLLISPSAHHTPGYHEGADEHSELTRLYRTPNIIRLLVLWFETTERGTFDSWPKVIYYLMGANEWRSSDTWPPADAAGLTLYLQPGGILSEDVPSQHRQPDCYVYDPENPTPTVGGSIVSFVYPPGSVDVSAAQRRSDVLIYTSHLLEHDVDVVGPVRLILFVSSSAVDTDFSARLSDVFPDGRAIQIQSGMLRTRYRNPREEPQLLQPGKIYRLEIDLWATANRFQTGHRIRLDVSSADFPKFDRHTNRVDELVPPICATQTIFHDRSCPSHLLLSVLRRNSTATED
jgi:uncharacterized protein